MYGDASYASALRQLTVEHIAENWGRFKDLAHIQGQPALTPRVFSLFSAKEHVRHRDGGHRSSPIITFKNSSAHEVWY